jgi:hypothetical protein
VSVAFDPGWCGRPPQPGAKHKDIFEYRKALAEAVAEARAEELKRAAEEAGQLDLFEAPSSVQGTQVTVVNGHRGPGRPLGARNKRTDEASRIYMSRFGDPLGRCIEIAGLPILGSNGRVLTEFAKMIGAPSRSEAFKAWQTAVRDALPYSHTRLATLTVKPAGSPDGEPISLPWSFAEDEVLEHLGLTHSPPPRGEDEP